MPDDSDVPSYPIAPTAFLRSPVGLSRAVIVLLGVVIAADLFSLWAGFSLYWLVDSVDSNAVNDAYDLYALSASPQFTALVVTGVVFIIWFRRVRINAEVFAPDDHSLRRGWAVWGWLCPVVNFWFPRRVALDAWNASEPADAKVRGTGVVNAWWTAWLAGWFCNEIAGRMYARADAMDVAEVRTALQVMTVSDLLDIAGAVLAMLFVHRLTCMQQNKALAGPATPPFVPNLPAL
ncbi:DUF4328 domain-containing protein [Streptomyces sp. N35]|uniref:DUF4328 domain-containing protein n=1 Tax=Streptomyces sp. N35 TaxID=2795730 RepID=UPI0018F3CCAE|nr:DUF4328 domain-containing protein [Streptomyces sp. N35]